MVNPQPRAIPAVALAMRYPDDVGLVWASIARFHASAFAELTGVVQPLVCFPSLTASPAFDIPGATRLACDWYDTRTPASRERIRELVREHRIEIAIYVACLGQTLDLRFLRSLGLKTINFEVDSYPTDFERSKFKWTLKRLLRGWLKVGVHDCYIANAHHQRRFLLDFAALPPDRIVTVVNGIDAGKFCPGQPPDPASLGLPRTDYYIVSISQARPEKRVDVAIEAAAEIFRTRPELSLTFIHIGDGQCLEPWKAKAAELGLGDRFQFPGSRSDVLPYLRLATAFVHPAERESFGFAVVEAMACAKPVVAARSAGPAEIIVPEATGFLVDSGDAKSLARELLKLVDDPSLREGMGRAARERVLEHYDSRKQALELARAIRERLK